MASGSVVAAPAQQREEPAETRARRPALLEWLTRFWSAIVLTFIIAGAAALALYWVFLVPIYQAPDENTHLDYAWEIYSAGRLITARDAHAIDNHPFTTYLDSRVGLEYIAFRHDMKVPDDYGTKAFYAAIDRDAPHGPFAIHIPVLLGIYPFGYYALLALWLGAAHLVTPSLVALFFAGRIFSVLLLCCSLLLSYGALRELRLSRQRALTLTAIVGFFPMTTFVSSYIQPDNLSFTLVWLCLYLALVLRRRLRATLELRALVPVAIPLSLALGYLCVTKTQFGACLWLSALLMLAIELLGRLPLGRVVSLLGAMLVPTLLLGVVHLWVVHGSTVGAIMHGPVKGRVTDYDLRLARHEGFYAFASYLTNTTAKAFQEYFATGGGSFNSFLGYFGWMDTGLIFHSLPATAAVQQAAGLISIALIMLTLLRLEQITSRGVVLFRRGRRRAALRAVLGNPVYTSFGTFTLFMLAFYVYTNNTFGAQGRNWLPFLPAIVLTCIEVAPRALSRPLTRRVATYGVIALLATYAIVGSYEAIPTLRHRFYLPAPTVTPASLPQFQTPALGYIDKVDLQNVQPGVVAEVVRGAAVEFDGWVLDPTTKAPAEAVFVSIDGGPDQLASYGVNRADVAQTLKTDAATNSGFAVVISTQQLSAGVHQVTVKAIAQGETGYNEIASPVRIDLK